MNLPEDFINRTQEILGLEWNDFQEALEADTPTSIRVNTKKTEENPDLEKIAWCNDAYYLPKRPSFTFDPSLHAGAYYVQEASSMFVAQAIKQLIEGDVCMLDLCAAPGGKSTLLSSLLSEDSVLVSNEIIRSRSHILAENLMKWGNANSVVCNNTPADLGKLRHFFDAMLIDAPCSGEGMFRKDNQAIEEWSVNNVNICARRQEDIIQSVWDALKPNGLLLYSTCTYNREENEELVSWICNEFGAEVISLIIDDNWGITKSVVKGGDTYHFYPHKTKGEGFFFAALRKSDEETTDTIRLRKKKTKTKQAPSIDESLKSFLSNPEEFEFAMEGDMLYAFPKNIYPQLELLKEHLHIIHMGVCLGTVKGKDFIPHQSLALSLSLNKDSFHHVVLEWKEAISFLRKETLILSADAPKGYILLTYNNLPIGFVKNMGNRTNNLYPQEWRIRSSNVPNNSVKVL